MDWTGDDRLAAERPSVQVVGYGHLGDSNLVSEQRAATGEGRVGADAHTSPVIRPDTHIHTPQCVLTPPPDNAQHLNIAVPRHEPDPTEAIEAVLPWVISHKGSVSAEHGLGQLKAKYLPLTKPPEVVAVMQDIKRRLDPKGILNPYGKFYGAP